MTADRKRLARLFLAPAVWGFVSIALFACAWFLTVRIVAVSGHVPFGKETYSPFFVSPDAQQTISIYYKEGSEDLQRPTRVTYSSVASTGYDASGYANLHIQIPHGAEARIVVDDLVDTTSCTSPRSPWEQKYGWAKPLHVAIETPEKPPFRRLLYVVIPEPSPTNDYYVECKLNAVSEAETFTTKRVGFNFETFPLVGAIAEDGVTAQQYGLEHYSPVHRIIFGTAIEGSDRPQFEGGHQEPGLGDTERAVASGDFFEVRWTDPRNEQTRDIFLVLIGTAVALGATTLIEGLRPVIDFLTGRFYAERKDIP